MSFPALPHRPDLTAEGALLANLAYAAELNGDPEVAHAMADKALLLYVESQVSTMQAHSVRQAFAAVKKWYA